MGILGKAYPDVFYLTNRHTTAGWPGTAGSSHHWVFASSSDDERWRKIRHVMFI